MKIVSELLQPFMQSGIVDTISRFTGGSPEATKRTLESAVPTTMYAIADHGSSETGARNLIDGLRSGAAPSLDVDDAGVILADPKASHDLMTSSQGFLERTMGGKLSGFVDGLASSSGVGRGIASKILGVVAPLALGVIAKRVRNDNLDSRGLAGFLGSQKSGLAQLVPGPMRSIVGADFVDEGGRRLHRRETHVEHEGAKKWWPWLLAGLAALGLIGLLASRSKRKTDEEHVSVPAQTEPKYTERTTREVIVEEPTSPERAPVSPPTTTGEVEEEAKETLPEAAPAEEPETAEAPKPVQPEVAEPSTDNAAVRELTVYFSGTDDEPKRVVLDGLTFDSGASTLTGEGQRIVGEVADVLEANPDAKVRIEGFTDSTGSESANIQLSQARADELRTYLIDDGISEDRIETDGRGSRDPVASNEDPEGREQNRRVEIEVERGS